MKSLPSKSLIFAFFLIGVILGMVFIDMGAIKLPEFATARPQTQTQTNNTSKDRPVEHHEVKTSVRTPPEARAQEKPVVVSSSLSPQPVTEPVRCDRTDALAVRNKAQEMAVISEQGMVLNVTLGKNWAYYSPGIKHSFIEQFSASDTCLRGSPRTIHFYYHGEEVATTGTHGGIEMK